MKAINIGLIGFGTVEEGVARLLTGQRELLHRRLGTDLILKKVADLNLKPLVVTPDVSLAYSHLWLGGFTESGAGALDLHVASQSADSLQSGLGAKVALPLKRGATLVVPQIYASWQHEFANDSRGLDARLSQGSSTFAWQTDAPTRDFAEVGADVTLSVKNLTAQLDCNAEPGRDNFRAYNISAGLRWRF